MEWYKNFLMKNFKRQSLEKFDKIKNDKHIAQ